MRSRRSRWMAASLVGCAGLGTLSVWAVAGGSDRPAPDTPVSTSDIIAQFDGAPRQGLVGGTEFYVGTKRGHRDQSCVFIQESNWQGPAGGCGPTSGLDENGFMLTERSDGAVSATIWGLAPVGTTKIRVASGEVVLDQGFYVVVASPDIKGIELVNSSGESRAIPIDFSRPNGPVPPTP